MTSGRRDPAAGRILATILLIAVAACQPATPTAKPSTSPEPVARPTAPPQSATLIAIPKEALKGVAIQVWHPWFGVEASLLESQIAEFNKVNEWGITVRAESQNNYADLYDAVRASVHSDQKPDLAVALPEYAVAWDEIGDVVDLNQYVDDPTYGLSADELHDFPAAFWAQDEVAGKRLGVPAERGATFLVYNVTWAKELGFASAPITSVDFRSQACRAHQTMSKDEDSTNDAEGGWLISPSSMTLLSWMMAFGGGVLEGDGYHFLTPKNLEALTFIKQLYDDGCAWILPASGDAAAAFASRRAIFGTANLEDLPEYSRAMAMANNPDDWTVLSFPGAKQPGLTIYGSSYVVLKTTPEKQLASWLFARWLLSAENQAKWVETTGLFPIRSSSMTLLGDYAKSHPQWSAAVELIGDGQIQPQLESWREVRVMVGDGFDAMFKSNTPAGRVAEILAIMQKAADDLSK
jgi:multiple sugar transport system substrate-binding protein